MRYELTDLRVFLAIAEAKSLTAGASDMHLTAPSASYRLKNLEQAMGAPLFERTQKGMTLTPAGLTVRRYAETILSNVERLQGDMRRHTTGVSGHLRVFANSSTLSSLPSALSRFLTAYPNVNVDLEEKLSEETIKAVLDGNVDIGLVAGHIEMRGLNFIDYGQDELLFIIPPQHPLGLHKKISLELALAYDLVAIGRKSSNFVYLQNMAAQLGINPRVRVHAPSFEAVLQCVQEGVGISLVPRSVAAAAIKSGAVEAVSLEEPWAMRKQRVVARNFAELSSYAREFVRYATELAAIDKLD